MKQLLIVNSTAALNGGASTPRDLSNMTAGAIGFYQLDDTSKWLSAAPTKNFAIVLGGGGKKVPFIIPEVDVKSMTVQMAAPKAGVAFKAEITIPTPVEGKNYTLVLAKGGVVFNERSNWTVTEFVQKGATKTAAQIATSLQKQLQAMADTGAIAIKAEVSTAKITVTGLNVGEQWTLVPSDDLIGTAVTTTVAEPTFGDKAYIQDLASRCAAGKGFNYLGEDGDEIYPGYPETVEDKQYNVFTLRFAVPRVASKTRDEVVNQLVHIAIPTTSAITDTVKTILGLSEAAAASATSGEEE